MSGQPSWYPGFLEWWETNVTNAPDPQTARRNAEYGNQYFADLMNKDEKAKVEKKQEKAQNKAAVLGVGAALSAPILYAAGSEIASSLGLGTAGTSAGAGTGAAAGAGAGSGAAAGGGGVGGGGGGGGAAATTGSLLTTTPILPAIGTALTLHKGWQNHENASERGRAREPLARQKLEGLGVDLMDSYQPTWGMSEEERAALNPNSTFMRTRDIRDITPDETFGSTEWAKLFGSNWKNATDEQRRQIATKALGSGLLREKYDGFFLTPDKDLLDYAQQMGVSPDVGTAQQFGLATRSGEFRDPNWRLQHQAKVQPEKREFFERLMRAGQRGRDASGAAWLENNPMPQNSIMQMGQTVEQFSPPPPPQLPQMQYGNLPPGVLK